MSPPNSSEPILRSRLLPRVSFRMMMFLTAVAAGIAALARAAGDGGAIARGLMASLVYLVVLLCAFGFVFLFCWGTSVIGKHRTWVGLGITLVAAAFLAALFLGLDEYAPQLINGYTIMMLVTIAFTLLVVKVPDGLDDPANPFSEGQLPPQILPPREQRT